MTRIWLALFVIASAPAEIIDRIAISVGSEVITESELLEELRVTAFLNGEAAQVTPTLLRETGERMVDQLMIRNENATSRFGSTTEQEVDSMIASLVRTRFKDDQAAFRNELSRYQLTEDILREHVRWQLTAMHYISVRFTTGVQVRTEAVEEYFNREVRPKLPPDSKATAEDYRERIEEILVQQRANEEAEAWVKEARSRLVTDFHPEVFQ
jgi:hypothetical protein